MIANKITPKLQKAIEKYGTDIEVYRNTLNEFNEIDGETLLTTIKGLYGENNVLLNQTINDSGVVRKDKTYNVITLIDEVTESIFEGDRFIIKGIKFEVINIFNANMLDAYFEITLKRL